MKPKHAAIDLSDYYALLAVWELRGGYWQLQTIIRLNRAIALARESPLTRLVFPTEVNPNGVWSRVYQNRTTKTKQDARLKPPLKIHSVDPRTLQPLNQ